MNQNNQNNPNQKSGHDQQEQQRLREQQQQRQSGQSTGRVDLGQVKPHMEVVGSDGAHVGTVDKVDGDRIKLTKADSGVEVEGAEGGAHSGHHHYVSLRLVADVEGDQVRLSATGANAVLFEEEEGG